MSSIAENIKQSAKPLPKSSFFGEFYDCHIRDKGFMSSVELSKHSRSYLVRIFTEDLETEISLLSSGQLQVHTFYQDHQKLPFEIIQDDAPNPNPTGDYDFDERFCVREDSAQPSAPIREVLRHCADLNEHKNVSLQSNGIVSVIGNSPNLPFNDLMTLHRNLFKAYAQNPEVLDVHAEHQSVAQASIR